MLRSAAVTRITDGLGFNTSLSDRIISRLQEAQRDLEKGKTLPRFLLQEDQALTLLAGTNTVALPTGFLRVDSENPPHYTPAASDEPFFISWKRTYADALAANSSDTAAGPKVAVLRKSTIDFIVTADVTYNLVWSYYKAADVLTTDIENAWLANAPEWLIGEAGWRFAQDKRDKDAMTLFENLRKSGRAACFGEELASDDALGPIYLGENV